MKRTSILFFVLLFASLAYSQNPVFSQYYTTSLYLNPAIAGLEKDIFVGVNYRSQWSSVNLPFKTFQVSGIRPIIRQGVRSKQLGSVGASLFSDQAGPNNEFSTLGLSVAGAYNFYLDHEGQDIIATGVQVGFQQKRINATALQWSSQYGDGGYDAARPGENGFQDRVSYPQLNMGIAWNHIPKRPSSYVEGLYHGFSVSNINKPKGFFDDRRDEAQIIYRVHGAMIIGYNGQLSFSPHYLIEFQQRSQINFGANATYLLPANIFAKVNDVRVSAGLWYRVQDSFIFTFGLNNPMWSAGVSYDMNSSSFARNFNGANAFELSLSYRISTNKGYTKFSSPLM
jgi:type IX secretion system PorP/SprF family membrane protein